jgi:hypothetical protein
MQKDATGESGPKLNIRFAVFLVLFPLLLAGCTTKQDPIQEEREAVKELLFSDVQKFVGDAMDGDLDRMHLYHHGTEGQFGVDYTLCGAALVWERLGATVSDHSSNDLFVITMRLGNKGRILGETDLQFADASPSAMAQRDAPVKVLCSNSASPLPAKFEPAESR